MSPIEPSHSLNLKSLTEVVIRHFNLHEGVYQLNIGFKIGVGGFAMDVGPDAVPLPGAMVGVEGVSLARIPPGVNAPKAKAKVRPQKSAR